MTAIEREKTAVLIMDYQNEVLANYGSGDDILVYRAASVLDGARASGIPVIYVVVQFRDGYPEVGSRGTFAAMKRAGRMAEGSPAAAIHPGVSPKSGDIVVTKRRVGAFSGSELDMILRAHGTEHLILMGVSTSGCVLTTVRWAADLDYAMTVVSDCCSDGDAEVHRLLTEKIFPRQCSVLTTHELLDALPR